MARIIQDKPKMQFDTYYDIDSLSYKIVVSMSDGDSVWIFRAVPEKFTGTVGEGTFSFRRKEDMEELMNALWNIGLRPHAYTITNEHFDSVKEHLGDMKALVESAYKVKFSKEKK